MIINIVCISKAFSINDVRKARYQNGVVVGNKVVCLDFSFGVVCEYLLFLKFLFFFMACHPLYQYKHDSIWRFFVRYEDFLPYKHSVEQWKICLDLYKGLNSETRELVDDVKFNAFLEQTLMLCLNFFKWLAKDNFKKEYLGFSPLKVPLAYPFTDFIYSDTPIANELERIWSVNQLKRAF